ncbi:MAG: bifunctional phosphoserine phosphatase/homoserine phosphotransferase ThrH [Rhodospirillales bacterium]|nr:bifunctional phosphoserine phosphatase/homoserine phosphotransferase ThrH [Rhodospirillales bacterium]
MQMVCLDLEGVLVPEIWHAVAAETGIQELRKTTRDVADYDALMRHRIEVMADHAIDLPRLRAVAASLQPYPGARAFLDHLREAHQVTILSDTFYELSDPLFAALGRPAVFCHHLETSADLRVVGWRKRIDDHKRRAVEGFTALGFEVVAVGDSYNDIPMLDAATRAFLFRAPRQIREERSDLVALSEYSELLELTCTRRTTDR